MTPERALIALAFTLCSVGAVAAKPPTPLDRVIDKAHFEGVAIAGDSDTPGYVRVTGPESGRAGGHVANGATANWRWASVSKQVTAVIVMQEVAAGRLALDAPIKTYWPEWPQVFSDEITIRDLLRHTSGIADPGEDRPLPDGLPAFYGPTPGKSDMQSEATGFCAEHPREKPGGGFHYDNCDFIVLGALLEHITGRPFATLLQERIATPLGLRIGLVAPGVTPPPQVGGLDTNGQPELLGDLGVYGAAGSITGSPLALFAFDRALIGHKLLDAALTARMWAGDPKLGSVALGQWQFVVPLRGCAGPVSIIERQGQIGGVQVRNFILPASGKALVLFTRFGAFDFGEAWRGRGFSYEALSAVECGR